jgi:hypothetical protein
MNQLSTHTKTTFGVFAMIGLAGFAFGAIHMRQSIRLPFERRTDFTYKTTDQLAKERKEKLKITDSDSDSISDYEEMFIYKTSPFLADSDSDGESDDLEIQRGTDPNCPKGKTCQQERTKNPVAQSPQIQTTPTPNASNPTPDQIIQVLTATFGPIETLTPEKVQAQTNTMGKADLGAFLSALGIPQAIIDKTDESALRLLVSATIVDLIKAPPSNP